MLLDELFHQRLTFGVSHIDDLDTPLPQVVFAADKSVVLAEDDALDLVQDAGAGAHIARREGGIHGRPSVGRRGESSGVLQRSNLGLINQKLPSDAYI